MEKALWDEVKDTLKDRTGWETNQKQWYDMRYTGIKRAVLPYPNAPDMHYPLTDTMIEKMKPYYLAQVYGQQRLASFVSIPQGVPQAEQMSVLAEKYFDWDVKQNTNFERAIHTAVDYMLMYGRGPVKLVYDPDSEEIRVIPIRAVYIIAPSYTEDLHDSEWVIHVIHLSKRQFKANEGYKQQDKIDQMAGRGDESYQNLRDAIYQRAGITYSSSNDQIVLWEVYTREGNKKNGYKVNLEVVSPILGPDTPVKPKQGLGYTHGYIPICDLRYELADLDYYGTRGITEILSNHEMDLNKMWNYKLQFLDFSGQPTYKNTGATPSPPNFKNHPGKVLPPGVEPNDPIQAPIDFEKEMQLQRALAEDRVQTPDLSAGQHLAGTRGAKGEITATQVNAIVGQSGQGNDYRGRVFRLQLQHIYYQLWCLRCQYSPKNPIYLDDGTEVPLAVLHTNYRIKPSGSADSYDKQARTQRALSYYQVLGQAPGMKTAEFGKWVLEQDDPDLVARLYEDPQDQKLDQVERQGMEITIMEAGFPARVRKDDLDFIHVAGIAQYIQTTAGEGKQLTPITAQLLEQHLQGHMVQAQQKKDQQAIQLEKQFQPLFAQLSMIAMSGQSAGSQQPGAAGPDMQTPEQGQQGKTPEENANDKMRAVAAILTAMANGTKAGVPYSPADYSAALVSVGLPPLSIMAGDRKPVEAIEQQKVDNQKEADDKKIQVAKIAAKKPAAAPKKTEQHD